MEKNWRVLSITWNYFFSGQGPEFNRVCLCTPSFSLPLHSPYPSSAHATSIPNQLATLQSNGPEWSTPKYFHCSHIHTQMLDNVSLAFILYSPTSLSISLRNTSPISCLPSADCYYFFRLINPFPHGIFRGTQPVACGVFGPTESTTLCVMNMILMMWCWLSGPTPSRWTILLRFSLIEPRKHNTASQLLG
jgi:hypothetical protein